MESMTTTPYLNLVAIHGHLLRLKLYSCDRCATAQHCGNKCEGYMIAMRIGKVLKGYIAICRWIRMRMG